MRKIDGRAIDTAIPWALIGAAAAHTVVAATASPAWGAIRERGVWNAVANDDYPAMTTVWFTAAGAGLLGWGLLARRALRDTGSVPPETGWLALAVGVPVSIVEPASGGWLLTAIGVVALARRRLARDGRAA